jgi:AcrR family transcriptional regulator
LSSQLETETEPAVGKRASNRARRSADLGSAGLEAFLNAGYAGASVERIAAAAGVARGTFYLYHPNKEALFCALLDRLSVPLLAAIEHARDEVRRAGSIAEAQSVYARLGAEIAIVLSGRLPLVRLMLAEGRSAGPGGEAVRERLRRAEGLTREILEEGTRRGLHRPHDSLTASLAITGAVERLAWAVVSGEVQADPVGAATELVEMFRRALSPT